MAGDSHHPNYKKIYLILLALLFVSIIGPEIGIKWLTLITAFGIAIIKSYMVCGYFMHLNFEKRYIWQLFLVSLAFIGVLFFGLSADIMKPKGTNWKDCMIDQTCIEQRF